MAANESLEDVVDEITTAQVLRWGETIAEQFVLKTKEMEDEPAYEYLAPYSSALRKMMRAMGQWATETDYEARLEWWNRIEQNGKTLYTDSFILPTMDVALSRVPANANTQALIEFAQRLIETQRAQG